VALACLKIKERVGAVRAPQADTEDDEDEGAGDLYGFAQECLDRCVWWACPVMVENSSRKTGWTGRLACVVSSLNVVALPHCPEPLQQLR
jgi:hypothetical protein